MSIAKEKFSFSVLERLKEALKLDSDAALARHFGIEPYNIRDWKRDDTIKYRLIIEKAKGINLHWLFTGEGPMFVDPAKEPSLSKDDEELLELFHSANKDIRAAAVAVLRSQATSDGLKKRKGAA